jgi:hypothetical protein
MTTQMPVPPPEFVATSIYQRLVSIEDLTAKFLRENYLLGLKFVDELNREYPDSWYLQKIAVAISNFEHHSNLTLTPREITGEMHDYYIRDYEQYAYIQLFHYPVIVKNDTPVVKAIYPTGQLITTFPREWCRVTAVHGQIQLIPTQGTLSSVILGQGGSYLPIIYQGLGYLPQLFHVDYVAGFDKGQIPQVMLDAIAKLATIDILSIMGMTALPTGITSQSYSIDGMSQSRGFLQSPEFAPVFSGIISQYKRELFGDARLGTRGLFADLKSFYRGLNSFTTA